MNSIIIDDDEACRTVLKQLIDQVDYLKLVGVYTSALEANAALKKEKIDLVFLDIEMPEMTGMDMLRSFEMPSAILTTSHKEFALDAFEHNIVDYLVKPITMPRFMKAVEKAKAIYKKQNGSADKDYFFIKKDSVHTKIPTKDILWIEALGDYLTVHTHNEKFVLHLTLKAIENKLPPDKFVRVHRSFIVHVDNISTIEDTTIYINNVSVPIGALYKENFQRALNLL
ncbi:MAG TPA: LytTR family DNA-binding domain-containing protein [Bacteroidia bacterium]|jgi:DNA-binding LytR/AlgR family response regulator|nr:LytTR family DNA-binding domain-containing protein [Bacteroidia bacterium]